MRVRTITVLLACLFAVPAVPALATITCKPLLTIKNVRELRASTMPPQPWTWRATIVADASYCATQSGWFEVDAIRIKEYAPDVQFTEKYRWTAGQFDVSIELTADEAINDYRIGFIAPCVCREMPYEHESWRRGTDREPSSSGAIAR
ncbi:MAG: hypothetical protein K2Y71_09865 [Xanthobacteraceae bacterium]|nr:hypothetical protein [Xanthobacteraceae bacterium]